MRIFITGCARSGTTLLKRLFYSFKNTEIVNKEINIVDFIDYSYQKPILIGKRNIRSIFSNTLTDEEMKRQFSSISDVKIINIIRNGKDVIESGKTSPLRWLDSIEMAMKFKDKIDMTIHYESLVQEPDIIQENILELFKLETIHKFSEYPAFVPKDEFTNNNWNYSSRSISTDRINKKYDWKSKVDKSLIEKFINYNNEIKND